MAFNHKEKDYMDKIQVGSSCSAVPLFQLFCCEFHVRLRTIAALKAPVFQDATDGRGVNVIVEMLSNVNLSNDLNLLACGGRVTVSSPFFLHTRLFLHVRVCALSSALTLF